LAEGARIEKQVSRNQIEMPSGAARGSFAPFPLGASNSVNVPDSIGRLKNGKHIGALLQQQDKKLGVAPLRGAAYNTPFLLGVLNLRARPFGLVAGPPYAAPRPGRPATRSGAHSGPANAAQRSIAHMSIEAYAYSI
jgi:hypothetical protein